MGEWLLFGTDGCHLCEDAQQIITQAGLVAQVLDIIDNPEWFAKYGTRIPVIQHQASQRELNWPFDQQQLNHFIQLTHQSKD